MVYGGQRDGVRGRPVRKHRVYTGPRTVTGLLHLVELSSAVEGCALVAYLSLGLELLGRVARVIFAYLCARLPPRITLVLFPPSRRVLLAASLGA